MKTVDWTKPIFEETSGKPAKFIGFSSKGAAVVECCDNLYFVHANSGIRVGNKHLTEPCKKIIKFVNITYRYEPFSSYEEVVPLIGEEIIARDGEKCTITGIMIEKDYFLIRVQGRYFFFYRSPKEMVNFYKFINTDEPVGKKVKVCSNT